MAKTAGYIWNRTARAWEKKEPEKTGFEKMETSLKYSYDPDKVRFFEAGVHDVGDVGDDDLKYKDKFFISYQERDRQTGKFTAGEGDWILQKEMTFGAAIKEAVKEIRSAYKHNSGQRDQMYEIGDTNYDSPYSANIYVTLQKDNQVRISITRYKV